MAQAGGSSGSISDSLYSILTSLSFIGEQRFPCTSRLSAAVLSSQDIFEGRHIREAEDGESALFVTVPSQQAARRTDGGSAEGGEDDNDAERMSRLRRSTILGRSTRGQQENKTWALAKRRAPQRIAGPAQATPLRKRPAQQRRRMSRSEDGSKDPEAYLLAAKKLLTQYEMPRASEHVALLHSQYEGLMDAIYDLEESLQKPLPGQNAPPADAGTLQNVSSAHDELAALEAEIKREELEVFALKEIKAEREKELRALDAQLREKKTPAFQPRQAAVRKAPTGPSHAVPATTGAKPARAPRGPASRPASAVATKTGPDSAAKPAVSSPVAESESSRPQKAVEEATMETTASPMQSEEPAGAETHSAGSKPASSEADADATPRKAKPPSNPASSASIAKPVVPDAQFQEILGKMASVLPKAYAVTSVDASSVRAGLESVISASKTSEDNGGSVPPSPASTISGLLASESPSSTSTPVQAMEAQLLSSFLALLLSSRDPDMPPLLSLTIRPSLANPAVPEALLPMSGIKEELGRVVKARGWPEDLCTKTVYGLVAKRILRIDRRGREALVGFT